MSPSLASALSAETLESVGLELAIFFGTITVAVLIKLISFQSRCSHDFLHFWPACLTTCVSQTSKQSATKAQLLPDCTGKTDAHDVVTEGAVQSPAARIFDSIIDRVLSKRSEEALVLYGELRARGQHLHITELLHASLRAKPSSFSALDIYGALVVSAIGGSQPQLVEDLFDDMCLAQVERPLGFYESTMKVLAGRKYYREALSVYDRLDSDGLKPSLTTLSCLISFASECGELERATGFFEQLAATSNPSIRAYMTILRVYSQKQEWTKSLKVFQSMVARSPSVDTVVLNIVLGTGVAAGQSEAAEALLHEMATTTEEVVDVISYNTILKGQSADKSLQILACMLERRVKPSGGTFNTVMNAVVMGSKLDGALKVLDQMQAVGIKPDKYTCTILMKGLSEKTTIQQLACVLQVFHIVLPQCSSELRVSLMKRLLKVARRSQLNTCPTFKHLLELSPEIARY